MCSSQLNPFHAADIYPLESLTILVWIYLLSEKIAEKDVSRDLCECSALDAGS
jgi:hypothetical protein